MPTLTSTHRMELSKDEESYLKSIYYDPAHPAAFSGENKLYKLIKEEGKYRITHKQLKHFLRGQETYTLYKPARRRYPRRKVVVSASRMQADCDLMIMKNLKKWNKGFSYILLYMDDFSRKLWAEPLKTKTAKEVVHAFSKIFQKGENVTR